MKNKMSVIVQLLKRGLTISEIAKKLKINRNTLFGYCKRNKLDFEIKKGGRLEGSYDKKPRKRRSKKRIIGGTNQVFNIVEPENATEFVSSQERLLKDKLYNLKRLSPIQYT